MNLIEILKQCPKGMELDCVMYDNAYLEKVDEKAAYPIVIRIGKTDTICLTKEGHWNKFPNAKCVIFPKGKTTWDNFKIPFKTGDVICNRFNGSIGIFDYIEGSPAIVCDLNNKDKFYYNEQFPLHIVTQNYRKATEAEKAQLMFALESSGHKWCSVQNKIIDTVKPIFKAGDTVISKNGEVILLIGAVIGDYYIDDNNFKFPISEQDNWRLYPKFETYDKVLVRNNNAQRWVATMYSHGVFNGNIIAHISVANQAYKQCIPYKGNERLRGTINDCAKIYKTWEQD
jgi:hypothetical protein